MKRIFSILLTLCFALSCISTLASATQSCEHHYEQIPYEPTCIEDGYILNVCRLCGACHESDRIAALGHDVVGDYVPTGGCSSEYSGYCTRCEYILSTSTPFHRYEYGACWFCMRTELGAKYKRSELILDGDQVVLWGRSHALSTSFEAQDIDFEDGSVVAPAAEAIWTMHKTDDGYILRHKEDELTTGYGSPALSLSDHGVSWQMIPAEETNTYLFYCQEWNCYLEQTLNGWTATTRSKYATAIEIYTYCEHMMTEPAVYQAPTCKQEGILRNICLKCELHCDEKIPTEPHCYENGVCIWCQEKESQEHVWSEPVSSVEATCTQGAKEYRTCINCGDECVAIVSEPTEHTRELLYSREASCEYRSGDCYGCRCGKNLKWENLGNDRHQYGPWVETRGEACSYTYSESTCTVCGARRSEGHYGIGHSFGTWQLEKIPTCEENGALYRKCDVCEELERLSIDPFAHVFTQETVMLSCTTGKTIYTCVNCSGTYTETFQTEGEHEFAQQTVITDCASGGIRYYTCTKCSETYSEAFELSGSHDYVDGVCTVCGMKYLQRFDDVADDAWYASAVRFVQENDLMKGTSETTFEPDGTMTRAMLATVLWRYAGSPRVGENIFADVKDDDWYTDAISWAAHEKIVNGIGNDCYDPDGFVTREQLAAILYRYSSSVELDVTAEADLSVFSDAAKVSPWAAKALSWAVAEGLIRGMENGDEIYLDPLGSSTRAQVATIFMRYIDMQDAK